uniref:Uncharacterized protein n=1 Tax=Anguilla anguilla TaxID=7936 RepID=A0A0E9U9R5_ANGAN
MRTHATVPHIFRTLVYYKDFARQGFS